MDDDADTEDEVPEPGTPPSPAAAAAPAARGGLGLSGDAPTRSGRWPTLAIHRTVATVERCAPAAARAGGIAYAVRLAPRALA